MLHYDALQNGDDMHFLSMSAKCTQPKLLHYLPLLKRIFVFQSLFIYYFMYVTTGIPTTHK